MTSAQIKLVENSWNFVLLNTQEAGMIFYGKLFDLDPSLKSLFRDDINSQSQKLIALITFAVSKLHTLEEILGDVRALGIRHMKYNVKAEHYNTVATALLWTLEKAMGSQWDDEMKGAWVEVYTVLSQTMIEAGKQPVAL